MTFLLLATGVGILVSAVVVPTAMDAYRDSHLCGRSASASSSCYRLLHGVIVFVHFGSTRGGPYADVVIQAAGGDLEARLAANQNDERYIRTGARVNVETYGGNVTRVTSDGRTFSTTLGGSWVAGGVAIVFVLVLALALFRRKTIAPRAL